MQINFGLETGVNSVASSDHESLIGFSQNRIEDLIEIEVADAVCEGEDDAVFESFEGRLSVGFL